MLAGDGGNFVISSMFRFSKLLCTFRHWSGTENIRGGGKPCAIEGDRKGVYRVLHMHSINDQDLSVMKNCLRLVRCERASCTRIGRLGNPVTDTGYVLPDEIFQLLPHISATAVQSESTRRSQQVYIQLFASRCFYAT